MGSTTQDGNIPRYSRAMALLVGCLVLAGCQGGFDLGALSDPLRREPIAVPSIDRPAPDNRGVITYQSYQVVVARDGDTVTTIASRVGLDANELARHNGLPPEYRPRAGEVLALPRNVGGAPVSAPSNWSPDGALRAIETASLDTPAGSARNVGTPTDPLRHRVEPGETAYSIARLYNVSVTALASWNGLGPDLSVRPGSQLMIPVPDSAAPVAATPAPVAPAPVAPAPQPATTQAPPPEPAQQPARQARFIHPVDGPIARPYAASGSNRNEGVDYSVAAGTPVRAAGDGTVQLVTESTGSLGTIVLVRHSDGLMTVYARITNVTVAKDDQVRQGQQIGVVASGSPSLMHFEVRRGTDAIDPTPYLP